HGYRMFSYAFCVNGWLWVFFLRFASPDSGGARRGLELMEQLLSNTNLTLDIKNFDIEYSKLEDYLESKAARFRPMFDKRYKLDIEDFFVTEEAFGQEFVKSYQKFLDIVKKEDYALAMENLRPLVQNALEIGCKKMGITLPDEKH